MAEEYWDERRGWRQGGMRQLGNEEMRQQEKLLATILLIIRKLGWMAEQFLKKELSTLYSRTKCPI